MWISGNNNIVQWPAEEFINSIWWQKCPTSSTPGSSNCRMWKFGGGSKAACMSWEIAHHCLSKAGIHASKSWRHQKFEKTRGIWVRGTDDIYRWNVWSACTQEAVHRALPKDRDTTGGTPAAAPSPGEAMYPWLLQLGGSLLKRRRLLESGWRNSTEINWLSPCAECA